MAYQLPFKHRNYLKIGIIFTAIWIAACIGSFWAYEFVVGIVIKQVCLFVR